MTNKDKIRMLSRMEMAKHYPEIAFEEDDSPGELFFDQHSERFFRSTKTKVLWAENYMNRSLHKEGECYINDFYRLLGLEPINPDERWSLENGYVWLDFDHTYVDYEDEYDTYYIITIIPDPDWYY